jgi:chitinase
MKHTLLPFFLLTGFIHLFNFSYSQAPNPALVGYFHNWHDANAPYIQLDQVDIRYNIIDVAFAIPQVGTDYQMEFIPDQVSQSTFISQIQSVQAQNRKVLISIGGATAPISLDNTMERDSFIVTMGHILDTYNFDGIDIDLEGTSLMVSGGTISAPTDQAVINLIYAIKQIMTNYRNTHGTRLILTMAPETAFVQGGQSAYGGIWGAYLPVIDALRDSLEILHVQLYNSGSMYGIDGNIYSQGNADFIVAMCEAVIHGFNTSGGMFDGLPAHKVAVGLPACPVAAGGGYTDTAIVKAAINYLRGNGPQPGSYTLSNAGGYPDFRGMMTWSINWDAVATCGNSNEFVNTYQDIFGGTSGVNVATNPDDFISVYPNPTTELLHIDAPQQVNLPITASLYNVMGENMYSKQIQSMHETMNLSHVPNGIYYLIIDNHSIHRIIKQ